MELSKEMIFKLYEAVGYSNYNQHKSMPTKKIQLRKFEDMTEEEINHAKYTVQKIDIIDMSCGQEIFSNNIDLYIYLLSIGIDLFGAIEKGYAERITE